MMISCITKSGKKLFCCKQNQIVRIITLNVKLIFIDKLKRLKKLCDAP